MPTYDYQCDSCGHVFEAFQSMSDDPLTICPECEAASLKRLISGGAGIIFKGSGFYVNDNRKGGSKSGSKSSASSSSSDSTEKSSSSKSDGDSKSTSKSESGSTGQKKTA